MDAEVPEPGELRWAKMVGHPWWPGVVCNCPQILSHARKTKKTNQVHILFYNNPPSRAWINVKQLRPFCGKDDKECKKGGQFYSKMKALTAALYKAEQAQFMTVEERLAAVSQSNSETKGKKRKREEEGETAEVEPKKRLSSPKTSQKPSTKPRQKPVPKTKQVLVSNSKLTPSPKSGQKQGPKPKTMLGRRPGPRSKTRPAHIKMTYIYNDRQIPKIWKTPFVLMNTNDIPEDSVHSIPVQESSKKVPRKQVDVAEDEDTVGDYSDVNSEYTPDPSEDKDSDSDRVEEEDSDDMLMDSDDDPGWQPGGAKPLEAHQKPKKFGFNMKKLPKSRAKQVKPSTSLKANNPTSATKSKPETSKGKKVAATKSKQDASKGKTERATKSKQDASKVNKEAAGPADSKSKQYASKGNKENAGPAAKQSKPDTSKDNTETAEAAGSTTSKPSSSGTQPDSTVTSQNTLVVPDRPATGPEPEVGDFICEKEECKDGIIPFLWRYKKSGLIQKYERVEDKGKMVYESLLNYSDWWGCYAHKYAKVKVQVLFKYRNKEKVAIAEMPEFVTDQLKSQPAKSTSKTASSSPSKSFSRSPSKSAPRSPSKSAPRSPSKSASRSPSKSPAKSSSKSPSSNKTSTRSDRGAGASKASPSEVVVLDDSESEVSEPEESEPEDIMPEESEQTQEQEISSTTPEPEFQIGSFVLDIKDQRNVDNFAIWKIESQILLKKFGPVVKDGKIFHQAVKTYRGYKDIGKSYLLINVKKDAANEDLVEVLDDSKPKLYINSSMEDTYDKNPLLRHFYVYLQVFLSQALEPGFLDEIRKGDSTYTFPLGEIEKIIKQKSTNIERKARWTSKVKSALSKCPYLRQVTKPDEKKTCEAVTDSKDTVQETVFLFGSEYDKETLKQSGNSHPCQEFRIGKTAISYISTYHQLCHFKYNLYDKCLAKIKIIRETATDELDVTMIMDSCLGNKAWVLQNFEDFMKLVDMI